MCKILKTIQIFFKEDALFYAQVNFSDILHVDLIQLEQFKDMKHIPHLCRRDIWCQYYA